MQIPTSSRTIRPKVLYFGTPVLLIATCNPDGSNNLTPMSSAWALGNRVVLGLANLEREGECTLNVVAPESWQAVEKLAPTTGVQPVPAWKQGYRHVNDKFALAGLTATPSVRVRPPRVAECPLQMEARVQALYRSPTDASHDARGSFMTIETEVLQVHAHDEVTVAGSDHVDPQQFRPLLYVFRHYVAAGPTLGHTFKAEV